jgi:hypothetical protein
MLAAWISRLKASGVKGAHPDDYWINREDNFIRPAFPHFWDNPDIGDIIALGGHEGWRIVRITMKKYDSWFFTEIINNC